MSAAASTTAAADLAAIPSETSRSSRRQNHRCRRRRLLGYLAADLAAATITDLSANLAARALIQPLLQQIPPPSTNLRFFS